MHKPASSCRLSSLALWGVLALYATPSGAVDADAAQDLLKSNNCLKCHALDKKKDGPSYKETAAKYRGKPEGEERLYQHLTTGEKAKFPDGHEEDHKRIKAKDTADTKNLIGWILAQ